MCEWMYVSVRLCVYFLTHIHVNLRNPVGHTLASDSRLNPLQWTDDAMWTYFETLRLLLQLSGMFTQKLPLCTLHVILLILQFAFMLLAYLKNLMSSVRFQRWTHVTLDSLPDLLLNRGHFSVGDTRGLESSRDDVKALSELAPAAAASCSAPVEYKTLKTLQVLEKPKTYVS